jgi:hypothetical protein
MIVHRGAAYDWALKSPAFMGPRCAEKVQRDTAGNRT